MLLALWGHKCVEHIVGTRLPSEDKTQFHLMQIIRGVKEIFFKVRMYEVASVSPAVDGVQHARSFRVLVWETKQ